MPEVEEREFEVEQYELHSVKYRVRAKDEASAIKKVLDGEAEVIDNSMEYIETAEDVGMPSDENRNLAEALEVMGVDCEDIIPSIRSIEEV